MFELMRWSTVHPALVHFALGTIPVLVLSYGLGASRKSERWTFVGDVTLWVTAVLTFFTAIFGLVALLVLSWPGGLGFYKWLHLALGLTGTLLVIGLAVVRWRARSENQPVPWSGFGVVVLSSVVLAAAGWVGGEVLVFRAGMGVEAAARGSFAVPPFLDRGGSPANLHEAMYQVRGHWARVTTTLGRMLVEEPEAEQYRVIESEAQHLNLLGRWLAEREAPEEPQAEPSQAVRQSDALGLEFAASARAQAPQHEPAQDDHSRSIAHLGQQLAESASALTDAARAHDPEAVARAYGQVTQTCAACHSAHRWDAAHQH